MPVITYNASNFPAAYHPQLAGRRLLSFTMADLVWAAISVGRAELLHLLRYGPFSIFEIVYRAAMLFANLQETTANTFRRSSAYDGLDPSEKSAISYFLGMTLAKLKNKSFPFFAWIGITVELVAGRLSELPRRSDPQSGRALRPLGA